MPVTKTFQPRAPGKPFERYSLDMKMEWTMKGTDQTGEGGNHLVEARKVMMPKSKTLKVVSKAKVGHDRAKPISTTCSWSGA